MVALSGHRFTAILTLVTGLLAWWLLGHTLNASNDEGIYLSQAARFAGGESLYSDLFVLTGPGSFWLLGGLFKAFGTSFAVARFVLVVEITLLTVLIFLAARRMGHALWAGVAAFAFFAIHTADATLMTVNHRWDACLFATAGILAVWLGWPALGGALMAAAFWATPSMWIVAVAVVVAGANRRRIIFGGAAGAAAGLFLLAITGSLAAFIHTLRWTAANYSQANFMPYGSLIGGYGAIFADAQGLTWILNLAILSGLTAPAWLPLLCAVLLIRRRPEGAALFVVCGAALIASTWPRMDIPHLAQVSSIFYILAAGLLPRMRPAALAAAALAAIFLSFSVTQHLGLVPVQTPVGKLLVNGGYLPLVRWSIDAIRPGESLFAYPNIPMSYYLTGARNVSRYSYLQPGMMTVADEQAAIADLKKDPPEKVLFHNVSAQQYLRIWPSSDPARMRLPELDAYVQQHYRLSAEFEAYRLYTRAAPADTPPPHAANSGAPAATPGLAPRPGASATERPTTTAR